MVNNKTKNYIVFIRMGISLLYFLKQHLIAFVD